MELIGIIGRATSGKDTAADVLVEFMGYKKLSFASTLKSIATLIGWDGTKDDKPPCEHCGMLQGRTLLQVLGTEGIINHLGTDTWNNIMDKQLHEDGKYVIADVRFPYEVDFILSKGGIIWKIVRPGVEAQTHVSESYVDNLPCDLVINNDGTLENLREMVIHSAPGVCHVG